MTIREYLKRTEARFRAARFESARLEAAYIVSEATGLPHSALPLYGSRSLSREELDFSERCVARRLADEPYQYVFGKASFRNLELRVGPGCLIPRPETEYLVDLILRELPANARVCELGAGSGAISLSLASERPDVRAVGTELSAAALRYAEENRRRLALENAEFFLGDLFEPVRGATFDLVAANLPYIPEGERDNLPPNVRDYEPPEALFAGSDGLAVISRALKEAPSMLSPGGTLWFELDSGHAEAAKTLAEAGFPFAELVRDQYGEIRFLHAKLT